MTKNRLLILILLCTSLLGLTAVQVFAQDLDQTEVCTQIVEDAMLQLGEMCAAYGPGQVCIGNSTVETEFTQDVDDDFFTQPGDIADLSLISSLMVDPLDAEANSWGVAIIDSQASLPNEVLTTLDGKGAVYLALGGVTVTEATPEDNIIVPLEAGIPVTTLATADLRHSPLELDGEFSNVVTRIPGETTVSADAMTQDQQWVRVAHEATYGWIRSSVVPDSVDMGSLVEIGPDSFTRMQSFNLDLNGSNGDCEATIQAMLVQGPDSLAVDFQANEIPVQLESTVLVIPLPDDRTRFCTLAGVAILYPTDPARRTIIPPGFCADVLNSTGQLVTANPYSGTNIAPFSGPYLLNFANYIDSLLPTNIVHYQPALIIIDDPSGVGETEALITYTNVQQTDSLEIFCATGALPPNVCAAYGL